MEPFLHATAACLLILLYADARGKRWLLGLAKLAASALFIGAAWSQGALHHFHGQALFAGFVASAVGDGLLLSRREHVFLAGIGAFLLAHLAYIAGFAGLDPGLVPTVAGVLGMGVFAALVWSWLSPHLPRSMRVPVLVYVLTIGVMVATAVGVFAMGASAWLLTGAITFALSDLFVARDRFVTSSLINRALGLPLYYGAQLMLVVAAASPAG